MVFKPLFTIRRFTTKSLIPHPDFPHYAVENPKIIYRVRKCLGKGVVQAESNEKGKGKLWSWAARSLDAVTIGGFILASGSWLFEEKPILERIRDWRECADELKKLSKLKEEVARLEEDNAFVMELVKEQEAANAMISRKLEAKRGWGWFRWAYSLLRA